MIDDAAIPDYLDPAVDHGEDPTEIAQLLDDHHLVVVASDSRSRSRFAQNLVDQLASQPDSDVVSIHGDRVTGLDEMSRQLELSLGLGLGLGQGLSFGPGHDQPTTGRIEDVIALLREGARPTKHQYFIWHDADALLETDIRLFGQLVNAFLAVAAEREFITPDVLVLQRVVFLGGDKLGAYAEEDRGQFRSWLLEKDSSPFWEVVACVPRPRVLTYRLEG